MSPTSERRKAICHRELLLNRRFSPDVYESVIGVYDANAVEVDVAVRMRRMPSERRLSTLVLRNDRRVPEHLRSVARILAAVHAGARRGPEVSSVATPEALERLWLRSLDDMERFAGSLLGRATLAGVAVRALSYLEGRRDLLLARVARGYIVDGHGDLLADDIYCLDDGPRILDCLEFDDRLRFGDVLSDIAFLMMDLERLGHPELATRFGGDYLQFSGEHHPSSLLHHYIAYRALIRAKVACLRASDGDAAASQQAQQLLVLAAEHLKKGEITLAIVGGLPGSGKSTLAENIGQARNWPVLRSDVIRKELAGAGPAPNPASFDEGIYQPDMTEDTYVELLERAEVALRHGESVVLDASFGDDQWRQRASRIASATKSRFVPICCEAPAEERTRRIRERPHDVSHPSDATPEIVALMALRADPWPEAHRINTGGSVELSARSALGLLTADDALD